MADILIFCKKKEQHQAQSYFPKVACPFLLVHWTVEEPSCFLIHVRLSPSQGVHPTCTKGNCCTILPSLLRCFCDNGTLDIRNEVIPTSNTTRQKIFLLLPSWPAPPVTESVSYNVVSAWLGLHAVSRQLDETHRKDTVHLFTGFSSTAHPMCSHLQLLPYLFLIPVLYCFSNIISEAKEQAILC